MFSYADLSVAAGKINLPQGYDFAASQAASCKHLQSQNRRFRVFAAGYWKIF
jgi:hypothetical protein